MVNVDEIFNKRCNKLCIFIKILKRCWNFPPCIHIHTWIFMYKIIWNRCNWIGKIQGVIPNDKININILSQYIKA